MFSDNLGQPPALWAPLISAGNSGTGAARAATKGSREHEDALGPLAADYLLLVLLLNAGGL